MSGNSGAWGISMWRDDNDFPGQENGISLDGGDAILPYLATESLGWLTEPPEGLGVPPVRNGDVSFAQRDGVVQFADYYEPRILTFQATICNEGCPGCDPVAATETFLSLDGIFPGHATTPHRDTQNITGDLDVVVHIAMDDWTPAGSAAPMSKWISTTPDRSWTTRINTTGSLGLFWSTTGADALSASSTVNLAATAAGDDLWLRYTLDVDNGAAGRDIKFYTSPDEGLTWVQLGATVTQAGVTSVFPSEAPITVGAYNNGSSERVAGKVFYAEARRGIDGTVIANPDFAAEGAGTTVFDDSVGNIWQVIAPGFIGSQSGPVPLTARQKVKRLTKEWSRNCTGATLVIFSDCHNPAASGAEQEAIGPYLVHGRPRVADVTWQRSNIGCADVLLRFDAEDARLILADTPEGSEWTGQQSLVPAENENLNPNYRLEGLTMSLQGATVTDNFFTAGGPDGGSYFSRTVNTLPTSSPMAMALTPTGTGAIPIDPGDVLSVGWWARKMNPAGGTPSARLDWTWYNAGGGVISSASGTASAVGSTWERKTQQNIVAPALAEFVQFRLAWTGIPGSPGYTIENGPAWVNMGATATAPDTIEVFGDLCAYPQIILFPDMTAPITVTYGLHTFTYTEDILTSSVTIDTRWGRASEGTVDVTKNLSGDFTSPLEPGVHDVIVNTADPADTGNATIEWANAVVSG